MANAASTRSSTRLHMPTAAAHAATARRRAPPPPARVYCLALPSGHLARAACEAGARRGHRPRPPVARRPRYTPRADGPARRSGHDQHGEAAARLVACLGRLAEASTNPAMNRGMTPRFIRSAWTSPGGATVGHWAAGITGADIVSSHHRPPPASKAVAARKNSILQSSKDMARAGPDASTIERIAMGDFAEAQGAGPPAPNNGHAGRLWRARSVCCHACEHKGPHARSPIPRCGR
jgi:hypothetical protein